MTDFGLYLVMTNPVVGYERCCEAAVAMAKSVPFPAVCIGGIDSGRLPELIRAGAINYAVVHAVCGAEDPYGAIRQLQEIACGS